MYFFSNQYSIVNRTSVIPEISFKTNQSIYLKNLNPNKEHYHDNLYFIMINICNDSIVQPLMSVFKSSKKSEPFSESIISAPKKKGNNIFKKPIQKSTPCLPQFKTNLLKCRSTFV